MRFYLLVLVVLLGCTPSFADDVRELPASVLLTLPAGSAPEEGWPVFVMMHGYGVNKEDFTDLLQVVASRGAAGVAVDAPRDLGDGRRSWGRAHDTAETHAYLTTQLAPLRNDSSLDWSVIHVGGFSQGGIQSLMLVVNYPDIYGGALSVSPAGGAFPKAWRPGERPHPLVLISGEAESEHILDTVKQAEALWLATKQPIRSMTHPGGHHFPADWVDVMGEAVQWIMHPSAP